MEFVIGQRWASHGEKTLGLGVVTEIDWRRVTITYPAVGEARIYASETAPLNRIRYQAGDQIKDMNEATYTVESICEEAGLITYRCLDKTGQPHDLPELELDCFVQFTTPAQRLFSGQFSKLKTYALRIETLLHCHRLQQSKVRGLLGARTNLLPHQLYIANEVASRHAPRVLLADEVGLGKTIEAGLIAHHQILNAQAKRILVLVPETLLHQWLVEMLRRFNLAFAVFDAARIEAILEGGESNPFEAEQRVLCSLETLCSDPEIQAQALTASWDMLVVDEAHHLHWSATGASPEYTCVEQLAQTAQSLLLLTATPEQLGIESHFARLRLLDPARFHDLETFKGEQAGFETVNALVTQIQDSSGSLPADILAPLQILLGEEVVSGTDREYIIQALLDRHGTGRVLFRNTRNAVSGFPTRQLSAVALPLPQLYAQSRSGPQGYFPEHGFDGEEWIQADPRVAWLQALAKSLRPAKILVICHHAETTVALEKQFNLRAGIRCTAFHEGLGLIERDRAAAWFAETDSGAQVMLCSEIGSEGRNFQFAQHLVLFDLPLDPDLIEQRIGRLDRIGQRESIHIHVPYLCDSAHERLFHWYHEGLDIFQQSCAAGYAIYEKFKPRLLQALNDATYDQEDLIQDTRRYYQETRLKLEQGRDRLLELNSCDPDKAQQLIDDIEREERSQQLSAYMLKVFEHFGVDCEDHSDQSLILRPSGHMRTEHFPGLRPDGISITYDRDKALVREDLDFLSWEHPMVGEVMEMILKNDTGNASLARINIQTLRPGSLLLEAWFSIDCVAPAKVQLQRYFPITPTRLVIDTADNDCTEILPQALLDKLCQPLPLKIAQALVAKVRVRVEQMLATAQTTANTLLPKLKADAGADLHRHLGGELHRLEALRKVNPGIRDSELQHLESQQCNAEAFIARAEFQLQAVRLIING